MGKQRHIFYNALLLTGVNLLLRFASTSFQVFLSGKIGPEGIGLLQLVLSVGTLAMTVGMGGIRTATMYLSAETVGQRKDRNMVWVLSGCIAYSILLSSLVAILLYSFAPNIAVSWIGNSSTVNAIRLLACFLPVNCLCGVMVGHFTGINRIGTLATVEVMEQLFFMLSTILLSTFWAENDTAKACLSVIIGSGLGVSFTLLTLLILKQREHHPFGPRISMAKKLWETAVPLGIADDIKAGISTTENLMVPKRLSLFLAADNPLAAFGMVCGMVFPVLMFPAAIVFGLAELLIPELARCNAAGSTARIQHLSERSLLFTLIYGCICGGILFLCADPLCMRLYKTQQAGEYLRWYALLAPMLYCDAITDSMTKGLGQQKICVRYNIDTSALDVILLFILLPKYGMAGYFMSFFITHLINFLLSIRLLLKLIGHVISLRTVIWIILSAVIAVVLGCGLPLNLQIVGFIIVFSIILTLLGVVKRQDLFWLKGLIKL